MLPYSFSLLLEYYILCKWKLWSWRHSSFSILESILVLPMISSAKERSTLFRASFGFICSSDSATGTVVLAFRINDTVGVWWNEYWQKTADSGRNWRKLWYKIRLKKRIHWWALSHGTRKQSGISHHSLCWIHENTLHSNWDCGQGKNGLQIGLKI